MKTTKIKSLISSIAASVMAVAFILPVVNANSTSVSAADVRYQSHVQNIGWGGNVYNHTNNIYDDNYYAGTTGRSLQMEALRVSIENTPYSGGVYFQAHMADIGWGGNVYNSNNHIYDDNYYAGTVGQSRRVEAVRIGLYGEIANYYHIQYQVHMADIGWGRWVTNLSNNSYDDNYYAGTVGQSRRIEAIRIRLVRI